MEDCFLGIEIGGTKLQLVAGSSNGKIHQRARFHVDRSAGADGIRHQIVQSFHAMSRDTAFRAIGVGFGGPIDVRSGFTICSHQIQGWDEFPLQAWLTELSGLPVGVENDANVAALGEAVCGAGRQRNPAFYITLGSGVGGGLVVENNIYHGAPPGEAEIGHLQLDRKGTTVESACSGWAMDQRIRHAIAEYPDSPLAGLVAGNESSEARFLAAAMQKNDPVARKLMREHAEDLAWALSHAVHLFHPEVVVLGGGLALIGPPLQDVVAAQLPNFLMRAMRPGPAIHLAQLGEDAVPVGALILASGILTR